MNFLKSFLKCFIVKCIQFLEDIFGLGSSEVLLGYIEKYLEY